MKAEITSNGMLIISPETDIEAFALKCWNKDWFIEKKFAVLYVKEEVNETRRMNYEDLA